MRCVLQGQRGEPLTELDKAAREKMRVSNSTFNWKLVEHDDDFSVWIWDDQEMAMNLEQSGSTAVIMWGPGSSAGGSVRVSASPLLHPENVKLEMSFKPIASNCDDYGRFEVSILSQTASDGIVKLRCRMTQTINTGDWHFTDNAAYKDFTLSFKAESFIEVGRGDLGFLTYPA